MDIHENELRGKNTDFLMGYITGLRTYAVWKNGVEVVGIMETPLQEVVEHCIAVHKRVGVNHERVDTVLTK